MASIYNERMLRLYENGELYKSKRSSWGKDGYWSKNCSYGYAHYKPEHNEFCYTLGWKGIKQLSDKFGDVFIKDDVQDEKAYLKFMKHFNLKYDWVYTLCSTDLRRFYKQIQSYIMLIKI